MTDDRITDDRMMNNRGEEEVEKRKSNKEEFERQIGLIVQLGSAYVLEWMWRLDWSGTRSEE
jgi:hypothetical protein